MMKSGKPGEILDIIPSGLVVQTGSGPLLVEVVQAPGKPKLNAKDWANGALNRLNTRQFDPKPLPMEVK
jgi:methionyl-tRNA formyltransferase